MILLSPEDLNVNLITDSLTSSEQKNQLKDIRNIYEFYQDIKKSQGLVDYGDMIVQAWSLLKNDPSILAQIQKKIKRNNENPQKRESSCVVS